MTERAAQLKLAVDLGSDPISGSLTAQGGDPKSFSGWIELAAAIETARYGGDDAAEDALESSPPEQRLG